MTDVYYYETTDEVQKVIIDDVCHQIYNNLIQIYNDWDNQPGEHVMLDLITKYNHHYLVYYFLGNYYNKTNNLSQAHTCYKICIDQYPLIDAYLNMTIIYQQVGNYELAKQTIQKAYQIDKTDLRILNFIGAIHYLEKNYHQAIEHYRVIINQNHTKNSFIKNIYNNLGFSYSAIGKCHHAMNCFEEGLKINCVCQTPCESNQLDVQLLQNKLINYDYMMEQPPNLFDDFLRINTIFKTSNRCHRLCNKEKIKIGYVSPDFRRHVCAYFIDALLKYYDRSKFIVYCYSNLKKEDQISEKFKNYEGINWFNIFDQSTEKVCQLIESHQIDILIDLAGHTNGNRLDVFSQKSVPIQITYLGYPNSTGLTSVDYRITDKIADPVNTTQQFSEQLIYLPRCFVCYTPSINVQQIPVIPIKHDFITFGVMNKINKHNQSTFKAWGQIIRSVPNSVLLIKSNLDYRSKYLKKMELNEHHEHQVKFIDKVENELDYYKMYNEIDICLDTFPYSGTTTSCDAFLMSTPIITLGLPNRHSSNVTKSMLYNMGFPELNSSSIEEYIDRAIKLANDSDKIIDYKKTIRHQFIKLMDSQQFSIEFDELLMTLIKSHKNKF